MSSKEKKAGDGASVAAISVEHAERGCRADRGGLLNITHCVAGSGTERGYIQEAGHQ